MKAMEVWGPEAQVVKFDTEEGIVYTLRRLGQDDQRLGARFMEAKSALQALIKAQRLRMKEVTR